MKMYNLYYMTPFFDLNCIYSVGNSVLWCWLEQFILFVTYRQNVKIRKDAVWNWTSPWSCTICSLQRQLKAFRSQFAFRSNFNICSWKHTFAFSQIYSGVQNYHPCLGVKPVFRYILWLYCFRQTSKGNSFLYTCPLTGCLVPGSIE